MELKQILRNDNRDTGRRLQTCVVFVYIVIYQAGWMRLLGSHADPIKDLQHYYCNYNLWFSEVWMAENSGWKAPLALFKCSFNNRVERGLYGRCSKENETFYLNRGKAEETVAARKNMLRWTVIKEYKVVWAWTF